MKYIALLLTVIFFTACSGREENEKTGEIFWTEEKAEAHHKDRQDPDKWDITMFNNDMQYQVSDSELPVKSGVFPTPDYDLIGKASFKGVGNFGLPGGNKLEKKIGDKTILYNSFFVGNSDVSKPWAGNEKDGVFFQIIVLTDFVDTVNYTHLSSEIISRNHPHYIGQGYYKTRDNKIEYLSFITADQHAYAIVNMRLFDLKMGKTILIAPQKDKSFRSMQIKSPELTSEDIEAYTDKLLKQKEIIDFFTYKGNI